MNAILKFAFLSLAVPCCALSAQAPPNPPAMPAEQTAPAATKPAASMNDLPDSPSAAEQLLPSPEPTGPTIVLDTTMGRLVCRTFDKQAPITVANFIGLAEGTKDYVDAGTGKKMSGVPFYDGTTFHRVIQHFMIQGGDRAGNGTGDPGYFFGDEFDRGLRFDRPGRLAMANSGPATNGSQFFVTEDPVPELNGKHTIFGQCDAHSVVVVQSITRVEKDANDKPLTPVVIKKVTIVREGQPMPAEPAVAAPVAPINTPAH